MHNIVSAFICVVHFNNISDHSENGGEITTIKKNLSAPKKGDWFACDWTPPRGIF